MERLDRVQASVEDYLNPPELLCPTSEFFLRELSRPDRPVGNWLHTLLCRGHAH